MRYSASELRNNEFNLLKRVERQSQAAKEKLINKNIVHDFDNFGKEFYKEDKKEKFKEKFKDKKPNEHRNNHMFFKQTITKLGIRAKKR